jgi:mannose-1-phosphate guanylyltransferase
MSSKAHVDTLVVVMAGGQGSRFWPLSRAALPKQFLSISEDGESLIRATVRRVEPLVGEGNIRVIAKPSLQGLIKEHVSTAQIFSEPAAKNTAACIGLAAVYALTEQPGKDPVLVILPADHAIKDEAKLRDALSEGIFQARSSESLVTIGIPPTEPNTGYGYIKRGALLEGKSFRVERFFEKPSLERAEKYLENGGFFWNSGMFVWRSSVILKAFQSYLPQMYEGLMEIQRILSSKATEESEKKIEEIFASFESISIDFGVLEHARNCVVVCADEFGWNDVGSWDQWAQNFKVDTDGNLIRGDAIAIDSTDCVIRASGRLVAAVGLKDIVVIDTGDALLVVSRDSVQEVRKVVEELKKRNRTELI